MVADTDDELHAMARKIGMHTRWAQHLNDPNQYRHHYDLTRSRWVLAVEAGAQKITHRELAGMISAEAERLAEVAT